MARTDIKAWGGERRKGEITQAAFDLIAEKGLEGFRVRDVAEKAHVNIATLHYYFPTKDDLLRAVVDHVRQFFVATRTQPKAEQETTAADELREEILNVGILLRENAKMFTVMTEISGRGRRDASIRQPLEMMESGWRSHLTAIIMRGQRDGSFRADLDPYGTASLIASLIKGMCNQAVWKLDAPDFGAAADEVSRWVGARPG